MFCSQCGAENKDHAKFCGKCGAALGAGVKENVEEYNKEAVETKKSGGKKLLIAGFFIIGILSIVAVLLMTGGDDLVGRWSNLDDDSGLMYLEFRSDGTLIFEGEDISSWDDHVVEEGSYWIEDDMLHIVEPGGDDAMEASYEITDGEYLDIYFGSSTLSLRRAD